jgi:hypothetical protein
LAASEDGFGVTVAGSTSLMRDLDTARSLPGRFSWLSNEFRPIFKHVAAMQRHEQRRKSGGLCTLCPHGPLAEWADKGLNGNSLLTKLA